MSFLNTLEFYHLRLYKAVIQRKRPIKDGKLNFPQEQEIMKLLKEMTCKGIKPSTTTWNMLLYLTLHCNLSNGLLDSCLQGLTEATNGSISTFSFNRILRSCTSENTRYKAEELLQMLGSPFAKTESHTTSPSLFTPDDFTFGIVLKYLNENQDFARVDSVFDAFLAWNAQKNSNAILPSSLPSPPPATSDTPFIRTSSHKLRRKFPLYPFMVIIQSYVQRGLIQEALNVLDNLNFFHMQAGTPTLYNSLISSLYRQGRKEDALKVYERSITMNVPVDIAEDIKK
jgi:pentatricopeptide repeat protein